MTNFERARDKMIARQLLARGISDERILRAMKAIPRETFVTELLRDKAHDDAPLDIGFNQTISQPFIVALMLEALELSSTDRVLEIGTGCGYQTAVLALLVDEVFTIEIVPDLIDKAQVNLQELSVRSEFAGILERIHFRCADGSGGWPESAPFDTIIVSAAAPDAPPSELLDQLAFGARMLIPVGQINQHLYLYERTSENLISSKELLDVRFVPLVQT